MNVKKLPSIVFRADSSSEMGLGHVFRCIAIAERLCGDFDLFFAIRQPQNELVAKITKYASIISLPEARDYNDEINHVIGIMKEKAACIVVLDGYCFDTFYQAQLKEAGVHVISIDDYHPFHYVADIVINHADGVNIQDISVEPYTKIYVGFDYALLRRPFIEKYIEPREIKTIKSVFICFGGADPANITQKVLVASLNSQCFKNVYVVAGSAYQYFEELQSFASKYDSVNIYRNLDIEDMLRLMEMSELAIVPASTIALECRAMHITILTGTTAANQKYIHEGLLKCTFVKSIGDFNDVTEYEMTQQIISFAGAKMTFKFAAFDYKDRILDIFNSLS